MFNHLMLALSTRIFLILKCDDFGQDRYLLILYKALVNHYPEPFKKAFWPTIPLAPLMPCSSHN